VESLNHNNEAKEAGEEISLGRLLKRSREERHIDFEEAFRATRIRGHTLEALENERWDELPSQTFVKGFLKTYAEFLGLDKKTVLELYERNIPIPAGQSEPMNQVSLRTKRWPFILVLSVLALALIASIMFLNRKDISVVDKLFRYMSTQEEPVEGEKQAPVLEETGAWDTPDVQEVPSTRVEEPEEEQQAPEVPSTRVEEPKEEQEALEEAEFAQAPDLPGSEQIEQKTPEEPATPRFTLTANVRKETWIAIYVDDQPVREYLFQPGETFTWKAHQGFDILVGNAGGIDFALNGKEIGTLGAEGKVVRVKLPKTED
jgi:cytoskeleton protein RodZ